MKKVIFLTITVLTAFVIIGIYSESITGGLSQNIVRLHVIANSDSDSDQLLKLKVRDAILDKTRLDFTKKTDVLKNLDAYREIAKDTITQNGYDYDINVEYGNFSFPTKHYNNISLPAGNYDALRIKIGKSEGKNWWCVMFPPLCFIDGTTASSDAEEKLLSLIGREGYDIVTSQSSGSVPFEIKFKIVEMYGKLSGRDKVYATARKD